jgi:hypothetical protein
VPIKQTEKGPHHANIYFYFLALCALRHIARLWICCPGDGQMDSGSQFLPSSRSKQATARYFAVACTVLLLCSMMRILWFPGFLFGGLKFGRPIFEQEKETKS